MPAMTSALEETGAARIMIYGQPGTRKTWWALRAAEFGFNVILCDFDGKFQIANQLSPEALARIYHLDMRATDNYAVSGAAAMAMAAQGSAILFDEATRQYVAPNQIDPEKSYARIDLRAGDTKTVLVIDSWSAFMDNISAINVPIRDAVKVEKLEWADYQKVRLGGDKFISNLKRLNCHVIVTGHAETYARKRPDADPKAPLKDQIEAVRVQPCSITRSHGETLARQFNDVLFFEVPNALVGTMINTAGSEDFDALTQSTKPGKNKWDDLLFDKFVAPGILAAVRDNTHFSSAMVVTVTGAEIAAAKSKTSTTVPVTGAPTLLNIGKK
jgi:hypothetical protein